MNKLIQELMSIAPVKMSGGDIRPARAILHDGTVLERVIFSLCLSYSSVPTLEGARTLLPVEEVFTNAKKFGLKVSLLNINDVSAVQPSPYRLPVQLAQRLYDHGESGMGYTCYTIVLRDGTSLAYTSMGSHLDFPNLPAGIRTDDIIDVRFGGYGELTDADYITCYFAAQ